MTIYTILLGGLLAVLVVDSLGSIASRQFQFNYGLLSPLSMLIFGVVAAYAASISTFYTALSISALVGLFDATVGWKISKVLEANLGVLATEEEDYLEWSTVVLTVIFALLCGGLGAYFWG
ncbi:MAG: hypothetical protein ACRBFS_21045 [Aureispira sp.]